MLILGHDCKAWLLIILEEAEFKVVFTAIKSKFMLYHLPMKLDYFLKISLINNQMKKKVL